MVARNTPIFPAVCRVIPSHKVLQPLNISAHLGVWELFPITYTDAHTMRVRVRIYHNNLPSSLKEQKRKGKERIGGGAGRGTFLADGRIA